MERVEHEDMCWFKPTVVDEMNRFFDQSVKGKDVQEHLKPLIELLALCERGGDLLDIGCGTAQIAPLCRVFKYHGADLPHVLSGCAMRNYPDYFYRSFDLLNDELAWIKRFDVIVLNAVIDIMSNGLGMLGRVLTHANKYVIVHRQEITENGRTFYKINGSYGGRTFHSYINRNDFMQLLEERGFDVVKEIKLSFGNWENGGSSFLLKNRVKDRRKYEGYPIQQLKHRIQKTLLPLKVALGAGAVAQQSAHWIATDVEELDVENRDDWEFLFGDVRADNFVAEHVWEHLRNIDVANKNTFDFLQSGGTFRVAVPDGYHTDPAYIEDVRPGGTGPGSDDHTILWTIDSLTASLEMAGFKVIPLEYWKDGKFHSHGCPPDGGLIQRSLLYDERNIDRKPIYTSLIVDAIKP